MCVGLLCGGVVAAAHVRLTHRVRSVLGRAEESEEPGHWCPSPMDWPEWSITSVVAEPDAEPRALISVAPPGDQRRASVLLLEVRAPPTGLDVITGWRDAKVAVMAFRHSEQAMELRRLRSSERVWVVVISDSIAEPTPTP